LIYDNRKAALERATSQSVIAGQAFGKMIFSTDPGWSDDRLYDFVGKLNPKSPMLVSVYRKNVVIGFNIAKQQKLASTSHSDPVKASGLVTTIKEALDRWDEYLLTHPQVMSPLGDEGE
jgi:hypothetical protein